MKLNYARYTTTDIGRFFRVTCNVSRRWFEVDTVSVGEIAVDERHVHSQSGPNIRGGTK